MFRLFQHYPFLIFPEAGDFEVCCGNNKSIVAVATQEKGASKSRGKGVEGDTNKREEGLVIIEVS